MERRATNLEELMITNFPEHDDVQWIKNTRFRDEFKQSLGWRQFHVVVLFVRR